MAVTIKDIAEQAGVSFSTVSKALRNSPLVKEQTKRKILQIAEEMGYTPNLAARKLVSNKSGSFGVIWPTVERATPSIMITRVNDCLEKSGYAMLLSINPADTAVQVFNRHQVDAILVFYDRDQSRLNERPISTAIPILYYGIAGSAPYPTIDTNRGKSIVLALKHVIGLGHHSIAYIGSLPYIDLLQKEKTEAYAAHMTSCGLPANIVPVAGLESHDGYLAAKHLLRSDRRPTAIVSGSYDLTRGILQAAAEIGIRIPEQLSLVSYDQIPQMDAFDIPLTAVGVDVRVIAEQLAHSLTELADGKAHPDSIYLEPKLIIRASTAPPPAAR